jgi:carbamoyl-phosphate synthase small subunit
VGISGVDTRAVTRHLRDRGAMRAGIFSGPRAGQPLDDLRAVVTDAPVMSGAALAADVTTREPYVVEPLGEKRFTVAAVDLGVKAMTPRRMAERGMQVHVLPAHSNLDDVLATGADGVFFSNGPGDPATADAQVELLRQVLSRRMPFFGICFGNQLLGRALGFGTYKLPFGHRGINQPVLDKATGRVEITAHNHGFAVDAPREGITDSPNGYGRVEVSHIGLNDNVVEGLRALDIPAFSVQYHPEAAGGPHDANHLFDRFADMVRTHREDAH